MGQHRKEGNSTTRAVKPERETKFMVSGRHVENGKEKRFIKYSYFTENTLKLLSYTLCCTTEWRLNAVCLTSPLYSLRFQVIRFFIITKSLISPSFLHYDRSAFQLLLPFVLQVFEILCHNGKTRNFVKAFSSLYIKEAAMQRLRLTFVLIVINNDTILFECKILYDDRS
jgi:hypothetical protein